jgi:two-component system, LytTR family, response regulator LytT
MTVLIVEDESLATERLKFLLHEYDPTIHIVACLESIEETVHFLQTKAHPDLLLMDIHLNDGHSFEIFKKTTTQKPIIFTTAYDNYAIDSFQLFSIDYILKPITAAALATAINKYKNLSSSFIPNDYPVVTAQLNENFNSQYKNRFLAKVGQRLFFVAANQVAYFIADNKVVYLVDRENNKYIVNLTIEKLEQQLEPKLFFRLNRKTIAHIDAIEMVKPYANNRLKLILKGITTTEEIVISREKVNDFKAWADT